VRGDTRAGAAGKAPACAQRHEQRHEHRHPVDEEIKKAAKRRRPPRGFSHQTTIDASPLKV
jgi:hypothetical protein